MLKIALLFWISFIQLHATLQVSPIHILSGTDYISPVVVLNNNGDGLSAWFSNTTNLIYYAVFNNITKTFEAPQIIQDSAAGSTNPEIVLNNKGEAILAWYTEALSIQYAIYDPISKTFEPAQTIQESESGSINPSLSINDLGEALLTWNTGGAFTGGNIQYAIYDKTSQYFSPAKTINKTGVNSQIPTIALSIAGNAFVTWYTGNNDIQYAVYDRPSQIFSTAQTIQNSSSGSTFPQIALNNKGETLLAWSTNEYNGGSIQYAFYNYQSASFSPAQIVSNTAPNSILVVNRINNQGDALLAWNNNGFTGGMVQYSVLNSTTKTFSSAKTIGNINTGIGPKLALNNQGTALLGCFAKDFLIHYSSYNSRSQTFSPATTIIDVGNFDDLPQVTLNDQDEGILIWNTGGISGGSIEYVYVFNPAIQLFNNLNKYSNIKYLLQ